MSEKPRKCPYCWGEPVVKAYSSRIGCAGEVRCPACRTEKAALGATKSHARNEAVRLWNERKPR